MGLEVVVDEAGELGEALARLATAGTPASIVMIDGALVMPGAAAPARWVDVRVKTPAGTFALKRVGPAGVAVVAFGNADEAARAMMEKLAAAFR
ncbi:MAG TPA: hypothetical protein VN947_09020 [Polyangia bacterium]|nr:hypothetical protein [Polyangia bacterium]